MNNQTILRALGLVLAAALLLGALALSILAKVRRKKDGQDDADDQPKEDAA